MEDISVYYDATGSVLIELGGAALELSRSEAEQLFVDLGFILQDMDITQQKEDEDNEENC